jgi:hypothetical protein
LDFLIGHYVHLSDEKCGWIKSFEGDKIIIHEDVPGSNHLPTVSNESCFAK